MLYPKKTPLPCKAQVRTYAELPFAAFRVLFKPPLAKGVGGFAGRIKSPCIPLLKRGKSPHAASGLRGRRQSIDARQGPVALVKIKPATDYEYITNLKAEIINCNRCSAAALLVQKRTHAER